MMGKWRVLSREVSLERLEQLFYQVATLSFFQMSKKKHDSLTQMKVTDSAYMGMLLSVTRPFSIIHFA